MQIKLAFQKAEQLAFVDSYDRCVIANLFDAFDRDCDGVLSADEGRTLLIHWLKGAHLHLLPVLHSLVAGLTCCKIRTALVLAKYDDGPDGNKDDDVEWLLSEPACHAGSMHAIHLKAQERGEMKASLVFATFGSRLAPLLSFYQTLQGLEGMYKAVLLPMHTASLKVSAGGGAAGGGRSTSSSNTLSIRGAQRGVC